MLTHCRLALCAVLLITLADARAASAEDEPHCPTATAANSTRFFSKDADSSADKKRAADLAKAVVTNGNKVCLLALMDPTSAGYSKKLALGRINWMRGNLMKDGVPVNAIGYEMRPADAADDPNIVSVLVITSP